MSLPLQGLIGTLIIAGVLAAIVLIMAIADDFIDRFKKYRKAQKDALAAATTNAQRK